MSRKIEIFMLAKRYKNFVIFDQMKQRINKFDLVRFRLDESRTGFSEKTEVILGGQFSRETGSVEPESSYRKDTV